MLTKKKLLFFHHKIKMNNRTCEQDEENIMRALESCRQEIQNLLDSQQTLPQLNDSGPSVDETGSNRIGVSTRGIRRRETAMRQQCTLCQQTGAVHQSSRSHQDSRYPPATAEHQSTLRRSTRHPPATAKHQGRCPGCQ